MRKTWETQTAKEVIETHYDRVADDDAFVTYRHYRDLDNDFCGEEILYGWSNLLRCSRA